MIEILQKFPALWAIFGTMLAAGVFWVANRKLISWQATATKSLIDTLDRQIVGITNERDNYRNKLHDERESHNACKLRIQELELRPDVTRLFEASEVFYSKQAEAMGKLVESIHEHDASVVVKMQPIYMSLETISKGIKELLMRTSVAK